MEFDNRIAEIKKSNRKLEEYNARLAEMLKPFTNNRKEICIIDNTKICPFTQDSKCNPQCMFYAEKGLNQCSLATAAELILIQNDENIKAESIA